MPLFCSCHQFRSVCSGPQVNLKSCSALVLGAGSVGRLHFTFYCFGKVETRRSCAAKFTFLYQVPLEWISDLGARGLVCPNRFEVVLECLHVTKLFTLGGQLKHLLRLASTLNPCQFILRASPFAKKLDSCRIQRSLKFFCFQAGYHGALVRRFHREFVALSRGWDVPVLWRALRLWCLHSVLAINSGVFEFCVSNNFVWILCVWI